jgi:hypothetical protein
MCGCPWGYLENLSEAYENGKKGNGNILIRFIFGIGPSWIWRKDREIITYQMRGTGDTMCFWEAGRMRATEQKRKTLRKS